uniref:Uncharacterized protein n=1 Tax=Coccolithus braarudii TaxID=221442 RepID=A0A7S0L7G8_9EUKA|mmetsp:Transcript_24179/g.52131  ORF Transcript_24179/g.52131 Transcript_24179/m.52131 type:complete len:287 (+) Transcript_24179:22-882(+)
MSKTEDDSCAFQSWAPLLTICAEYARLSGWRFQVDDFLDIDSNLHRGGPAMHAARVKAMPTILDWGERVQAIAVSGQRSGLLDEFLLCQRLTTSEAVVNSMAAMACALGLDESTLLSQVDDESCAYQDVSQPLPVIARRLVNYRRALGNANEARLLQASFVVEFGLAYGLTELSDVTSEDMLVEYLERAREWGGSDKAGPYAELLLRQLPDGAAHASLHRRVGEWLEANRGWVIGGAVVGALGLLVAGAALALSSGGGKPHSSSGSRGSRGGGPWGDRGGAVQRPQ